MWAARGLGLGAVLLLAGCGSDLASPAEDPAGPILWQTAADAGAVLPTGGQMAPLSFDKLVFDIPRGTDVGGYPFSLLCAPPFQRITWVTPPRGRDAVLESVHGLLTALGYDVVGDPARLFEVEEDRMRAEVLLAARVSMVRYSLCNAVDLWTGWPQGVQGEASVRVDWSLYSRLDRRMLLTLSTQGRGRVDQPGADGQFLVLQAAIGDAAMALGRDPRFRAALSRDRSDPGGGTTPIARTLRTLRAGTGQDAPPTPPAAALAAVAPPAAMAEDSAGVMTAEMVPAGGVSDDRAAADPPPADAARGEGGLPWIDLPDLPPFSGPLAPRAEQVVRAVVLVAAGAGHGSGVFVDGDGLILTNAHVVGHAERVRVVLSDGVALVGTVERLQTRRDVALVRVPHGRYTALPLRLDPPAVSADIYALGAPLSERNQGTLTRGIVSAHRRDQRSGYPLIQGDVTVQPGSSGGPLLDGSGNLIGVTVAGVGDLSTGLNYFIPIADALERLAIRPAGARAKTE